MDTYGAIQGDIDQERARIVDALAHRDNEHVVLRLFGSMAVRAHCPGYGHMQTRGGRQFRDLDFAAYHRDFRDICRLFTALGYEEDRTVTQMFSDTRLLFHDPEFGRHIDVFFERLEFAHVIPLKGRMEMDTPTLPLAELFLSKMQVVQIGENDVRDTIVLLREHPVGAGDDETVNSQVIGGLCGRSWGLWRTVTGNLQLVCQVAEQCDWLQEDDRRVVCSRIHELEAAIDAHPKSGRWKARGLIGERLKWYRDVEELVRDGPASTGP